MEPVTLVDAENVRRSQWPNIGNSSSSSSCARGRRSRRHALLVFDGDAPAAEADTALKVVGTRGKSVDDR